MRRPLVAFVLLAVVSVAFWVHRIHIDEPSIDGGPGNADAFRYFYPTAVYLHDELARGNLPIWNPYQLAGQPFLAFHITGVLYPPNLILMGLLDPAFALEVHAILHVLVAGFFTWLFAARIGLGPAARFAAAFAYMLAGSLLLGVYATPYFSTPAWLPAILWAIHGLAREGDVRFSLGLAVLLALCFLGGYAQGFVYIVQLAAVYAVFAFALLTPRERRLRTAGLFALAGLLSLGFVAPQLLPTLELTRSSVRSFEGLSFQEASFPYFSPGMLAQGLLRGLGPDLEPVGLGPVKWRVTFPLLALPLLVCGVLARSQRAHWIFFTVMVIAAGLFLLGPLTPLFELYYRLPLGDLFRGPGRLVIVYAFLGAILMAIGIDGVSQWLQRWRPDLPLARIVAGALALLVGLDYYARSELEVAHPSLTPPAPGAPDALVEFMQSNTGHERVFVQNFGLKRPEIFYKFGMMNEVFVVPDYEPSMPAGYARYFEPGRSPPWHGEASVVESLRRRAPHPTPELLDLMSVRYYAIRGRAPEAATSTLEAFVGGGRRSLGNTTVFERPDALPRAYLVRQVEYVADADAAMERIQATSFRPREEVIVVGSPASGVAPPDASAMAATGSIDRAAIVAYSAEAVEIAAECGVACTLVLTDMYYPGWRAWVDDREVEILLANALYRGIALSAGPHRIVFRYEPRSYRTGLALLAGALLAAGTVLTRFYLLRAMQTTETPMGRSKRSRRRASSW